LAGEVVEEIQQVANEGQQTILKINGRSRIITKDPLNVKNGFINLFSNATKYSPEGKNAEIKY